MTSGATKPIQMYTLTAALLCAAGATTINRQRVVQRHIVQLDGIENAAPLKTPLTLTVGNGVIGFNADATGMQVRGQRVCSVRAKPCAFMICMHQQPYPL